MDKQQVKSVVIYHKSDEPQLTFGPIAIGSLKAIWLCLFWIAPGASCMTQEGALIAPPHLWLLSAIHSKSPFL
jgi:hypothetical protein